MEELKQAAFTIGGLLVSFFIGFFSRSKPSPQQAMLDNFVNKTKAIVANPNLSEEKKGEEILEVVKAYMKLL